MRSGDNGETESAGNAKRTPDSETIIMPRTIGSHPRNRMESGSGKTISDRGKNALHGHAESRARRRTDETHGGGLEQVNQHRASRGSTEAAKNGTGGLFLLEMRLDRARHAHSSEKKRNKADEIEEAIEIFQRCAQVAFPFRNGVVFKTEALDLRHQRQDAPRIRARRNFT